jgi:hypothetical protein
MAEAWPDKDPDEVVDYHIDWSARLDGDTISTSTWVVPSGITKDSDENTTTSTTIWLSGGDEGATYVIVNRVDTAGGRTFDEVVTLTVASGGSGLVSLSRTKSLLHVDTTDDDALLRFLIRAASRRIIRHLKNQAGEVLGADSPVDYLPSGELVIDDDVQMAVIWLVGHMYRSPDNDVDKEFEGDELPRPVKMMLKPLRDPALA